MQTKKRHNPSRIKKMYNKIQNLFQNERKQIKWKINLLQDRLEPFKKRQGLLQNGLTQLTKMQNLTQNELDQITKMQNQSQDDLEQIAKMRRIKNYKKMSKEELIIALLKLKRSLTKLFDNLILFDRIREIKKILNELRDRLTKEYRKEIKKKLREIENKKNLSNLEKEEIDVYLTELVRILDKKEKYCYHDRDDPDYYGIRDIENLFGKADEEDYYKPILVKSAFKGNYKIYESRGDKEKKLSIKQYLFKIIPHLSDMINDHKATIKLKTNKSRE